MTQTRRIGFIGLGAMGAGMAFNIRTKGYELAIVGGRAARAVEELRALGATVVPDPRSLAERVDIVHLCLPSSREVEAVADGADGLLRGLRAGMVVVDSTTADPGAAEGFARRLAERGVTLVDAPVSRSPSDARAGKLNTMVGAAPEMLERVRPLLACFAENIFHAGPAGAGYRLKLIANFLTLTHAVAAAEATILARACGIDLDMLSRVVSAGGSNSAAFQLMMPWALTREVGRFAFSVENAAKDLRYLTRMAADRGCIDLLGGAALRAIALAKAQSQGGALMPQILDPLARLSAVDAGGR